MSFPSFPILAVDLSSPVSSLAICEKEGGVLRVLGEEWLTERNSHSELFLSALDSLLGKQSLRLDKIEAFLTARGPGSFTGLRIAFATLLGFNKVKPRIIYSLLGTEARVWGFRHQSNETGPLRVLTKIATGRFLESDFDADGKLIREEELTILSKLPDDMRVLNDGGVDTSLLPQGRVVNYPLHASDLALGFSKGLTLKQHTPESGYADFQPTYFGSSKFD